MTPPGHRAPALTHLGAGPVSEGLRDDLTLGAALQPPWGLGAD